MGIDSTERAKEDARRADLKRMDQKETDAARLKQKDVFLNELQKKSKSTEAKSKTSQDLEKEDEEKDIFSRIIEAGSRQDQEEKQDSQGGSHKKELFKKDISKKEDFRKDKKQTDSTIRKEAKVHTNEEDHRRVTSNEGTEQQAGGGGEGGFGGGQDSGSQQKGSGEEDSKGGYGSRKEEKKSSLKTEGIKQKDTLDPRAIQSISSINSAGGEKQKPSYFGSFSNEHLDEMAESVRVGVNAQGNSEMEIHLSDEYFHGLKLKVEKTPQGIIISFICSSRDVKNTFLINRPQIYARLKQKHINIFRIDIG